MVYQLDYFTILKATIVPINPLYLILMLAAPVIMIFLAYRKKGTPQFRRYIVVVGVAMAGIVFTELISTWPLVGSGWCLNENILELKAPPISKAVHLNATNVSLVDASGAWRPTLRVNGHGRPGFATGWFRLENGQRAVVFRYLRPSKMVVLEYQGQYYIIQHPSVENLYDELLLRGAKSVDI